MTMIRKLLAHHLLARSIAHRSTGVTCASSRRAAADLDRRSAAVCLAQLPLRHPTSRRPSIATSSSWASPGLSTPATPHRGDLQHRPVLLAPLAIALIGIGRPEVNPQLSPGPASGRRSLRQPAHGGAHRRADDRPLPVCPSSTPGVGCPISSRGPITFLAMAAGGPPPRPRLYGRLSGSSGSVNCWRSNSAGVRSPRAQITDWQSSTSRWPLLA